jgi:hypothetical protein
MTYKLSKDKNGEVYNVIKNNGDHVLHIPLNPENADYQKYLDWVAEGNTPEPADEV